MLQKIQRPVSIFQSTSTLYAQLMQNSMEKQVKLCVHIDKESLSKNVWRLPGWEDQEVNLHWTSLILLKESQVLDQATQNTLLIKEVLYVCYTNSMLISRDELITIPKMLVTSYEQCCPQFWAPSIHRRKLMVVIRWYSVLSCCS